MSSTQTSGLARSADEASSLDYKDAFVIAGMVAAVIVGLVVLRFLFYFVLDLSCDLDGGERRRVLAELLRKIFPCWHVRTGTLQSSEDTTLQQQHHASTVAAGSSAGTGGGCRISGTPRLSVEELVASLPSCILSRKEFLLWKECDSNNKSCSSIGSNNGKDSSSPNAKGDGSGCGDGGEAAVLLVCSICLNEVKVGDTVCRVKCRHIFHFDCLAQWVVSSSDRLNKAEIECPNCRTCCIDNEDPSAAVSNNNNNSSSNEEV